MSLKLLALDIEAVEAEYLLEEGHQTQKDYHHYSAKKSKIELSEESDRGAEIGAAV